MIELLLVASLCIGIVNVVVGIGILKRQYEILNGGWND
jgi:hypothetical protein